MLYIVLKLSKGDLTIMGNEGFFELDLLTVENRPANESGVAVGFHRVSDPTKFIVKLRDLSFPPNRKFTLPAFPQADNLVCDIVAPRFRHRKSAIFTLFDGETIIRNLTVIRRPDKWNARFDEWLQLPNELLPLKRVLETSTNVKLKGGKMLGKFTEGSYDNIGDDNKLILAKTALLNLFTKLSMTKAPIENNEVWFSFVQKILEIGRERFIALVDPRMGQIVRNIKDRIGDFPDYRNTPAQNHFGNMPAGYQVTKNKMFSIKSNEDNGNLQLTMAPAVDPDGKDVVILDADIDEEGRLLPHIKTLFLHKFNGGTHPFDIHEYLSLAYRNRPMGYELA